MWPHHHPLLLCLHHPLIRVHSTCWDSDGLGSSRGHAGGTRGQVPSLRTPWWDAERLWPSPEVVLIESVLLIGFGLVTWETKLGGRFLEV